MHPLNLDYTPGDTGCTVACPPVDLSSDIAALVSGKQPEAKQSTHLAHTEDTWEHNTDFVERSHSTCAESTTEEREAHPRDMFPEERYGERKEMEDRVIADDEGTQLTAIQRALTGHSRHQCGKEGLGDQREAWWLSDVVSRSVDSS